MNTSVVKFQKAMCLLIFPLMLSGCAGVYQGSFNCKAGKGVGCESVSQVNEYINNDVLDDVLDGKKKSTCGCKKNTDKLSRAKTDKIKIIFNSYKDSTGVLHKESEVEVNTQ